MKPSPSAPFTLEQESLPDALVVRAKGKFDAVAGEALEKLVRGQPKVVLNLQKIDYISSSGIAALVKLSARSALRIASPAPCVRDVISLAGIERVLSIHADEEAARRAGR